MNSEKIFTDTPPKPSNVKKATLPFYADPDMECVSDINAEVIPGSPEDKRLL